MIQHNSLPDLLQSMAQKGYQFADAHVAAMPPESIQSDDWRLDSVQQVYQDPKKQVKALVIAVSSEKRRMKLVFVEVSSPQEAFNPMHLLRRLFPLQHPKRQIVHL
ncbi:MAG: hypothetical protein KGS48_00245 [Bacteroidetes bacterium]|nr:hypothetical protein [Bacteroidota bacterium]